MIISTTESVYGHEIIEHKEFLVVSDLVELSSLRAFNPANYARGIKMALLGTQGKYQGKLGVGAANAIQKLKNLADEVEANAVVGVRIESSIYGDDMVEVVVYGTAVKAKRKGCV